MPKTKMNYRERNRETFYGRISVLKGYRGFLVSKFTTKWEEVRINAENNAGRKVIASGETREEAYKQLIDKIDLIQSNLGSS